MANPTRPFFRMGQPVRIPVSATSAGQAFDMPSMNNMKSFLFVNPTPYDIRLEGTPQSGQTLVQVTASTGWLILARSVMGPFTSKNPAKLSALAVSTPGNPIPEGADFTGCFLELVYGEGE